MNIQELRDLISAFDTQHLSEWLFEVENWLENNEVNFSRVKMDFNSAKNLHSSNIGRDKATNIVSFLKVTLKNAHKNQTETAIAPVVKSVSQPDSAPAKHIQEAFSLLHDNRYNPAISCAMNAVESALANVVGRNNKGKITLGEALKRLQKGSDPLPPEVEEAMETLWQFANTSSTRHGKEDYDEQTQKTASFIVGLCASIVSAIL